jgi:NADH-quinone oxidoreductase subunit H
VSLFTAVIQLHVVLGKTLLFCWLFIWVRWTLPRFRYDQIMALGWKIMLNVALANLLITALIAKLLT